jgi:DNA-3-methyladenine glycosylase
MATPSRTAASSSDSGPASAPVGRAFFDRPTERVARALLGATLRVRDASGERDARIVETEAYIGRVDAASHAYRGPTERNRSMFSSPGTLYVFRIHQVVCANLVTRRGEAVLLRAGALAGADPLTGSGPGRLCRALGITMADDGQDATEGDRVSVLARTSVPGSIQVGPRVGIRKAAELPLRFWISGDRSVSRPRRLSASASPSRSRAAAPRRRSRTTSRRRAGGGTSGGRTAGK